MTLELLSLGLQALFMSYFIGLNLGYIALNVVAMVSVRAYMQKQDLLSLPSVFMGLEPPVTVLAPAYNEEATIAASVRSLLQLNYPEFEVVVINDGSKDRTLQVLLQEFELTPFPEAYRVRLGTKPIRTIYLSPIHPNLRVIDKENGGKADSLNAGINTARYPLFCAVDADSVLQRDSLLRVVQPFLDDPRTICSGGCIRIANGCEVQAGFLVSMGLPSNLLALFQISEYLRAFLFGRLGWSPLNALLIVSGAFGVFSKEGVIEVGGYLTNTIGEDMELVLRLHRHMRDKGAAYRIVYVPDPICWTEAPEDLKTLKNQRIRWQRGLAESLSKNRRLLFHPRGGTVGWLAFPFFVLFEFLGPAIEFAGYLFMAGGAVMGIVSLKALVAFLYLAVGLGLLLSVSALLMEELSFQIYPKLEQVLVLFLAVVIENLGYRQLNSWWRIVGLYRWITAKQGHHAWGEMRRTASWSQAAKRT